MQKDVLITAFVLSVAVFVIGIFIGFWLDSSRVNEISARLDMSEIEWNDARLMSQYYNVCGSASSCENELENNLKFNEKIYSYGLQIEKYEQANRFAPQIEMEKKKYALLQAQFWFNSVGIREICNSTYYNFVYFYSLHDESVSNEQRLQSIANMELKEKCGAKMMLIVIPIDTDILTIDAVKSKYGIKKAPSILINEETLLEGLQNMESLEKYVKC